MKKIRIFLALFVGMLLLASYTSSTSAAKTYELTVKNFTTKTLEIGLVGPINTLYSLPSFYKVIFELPAGSYQFSYYDCGQLYVETVNLNKDREIKLLPCNGSNSGATDSSGGGGATPELIDVVLNNKTFKNLTVALVGIENYSFDLVPGKTFVQVFKGTYQFSYYDCGQLFVNTVKLNKDDTTIKILTCGQGQGPIDGSAGDSGDDVVYPTEPEGVQFFVKNETYSSFDVMFLSDVVHTFHVLPGKNKINLLPGNYQYSYYACGELWVGDIRIAKPDQDLRISSCSTNSGRPDTGQNIEFKVKNLTGAKFILTLDGPQFYTLDVKSSSSTLFEVQRGYYKFTYIACGQVISGEVFLKNGFTFKTIECGD